MSHLIATTEDVRDARAIGAIQSFIETWLFNRCGMYRNIQTRGIDTITTEVNGVRYRIQISRDVQLMDISPVPGACREDVSH